MIQMKNAPELEDSDVLLARVKDKYLLQKDIEGIVPSGSNSIDSANSVQRYVQNWVKKQLLISEAESQIEFDQAELQRKILEYRYALIVYEFEKLYINNHLRTEVTDQEIESYYRENKEKFQLKQNILRGVFLQLPKDSPKLNEIKRLLRSKTDKIKATLKAHSLRFATKSHLEDSVWLKYDDVFKNTPFRNEPNRLQFLKENHNRIIETSDDNFVYLIRIDEYRIRDEIAPLDFIRENLKAIIINKRKTELANELEERVFEDAVKNKEFEIYVDE